MTQKHYASGIVQRMDGEDHEENVFTFTASTDSVDRAGDIVVQSWDLASFNANPIILENHDYSGPVVGRALSAEVVTQDNGRKALSIRLQIDAGEDNPAGRRLARQIREGFVSAGSVGFMPGGVTSRASLGSEHPQAGARGFVLGSDSEPNALLEFSIVTVPMNGEALHARAAKSADSRDLRKTIREEVRAAIQAEKAIAQTAPPESFGDWWVTAEITT